MGKCSVCKKKIEYNQYKVIDGIIYCLGCVSKKEAEEIAEVIAAEEAIRKDAEEQLEREMAPEPEDKGETLVTMTAEKPKKKRGRKKQ